jgi:hypothetical protein
MRRRVILGIAAGLLLCTPLLASARLRALLRGADGGVTLTTQREPASPAAELDVVQTLLERLRGVNSTACEMAMVALDRSGWFGRSYWGMSPLAADSVRVQLPGELHADGTVDALTRSLSDGDACVRRGAASLLGRARSAHATRQLRATMSDASSERRALAVFAAGLSEDSVLAGAVQGLLRDPSEDVRATAAWTLGRMEYRPAIVDLSQLLGSDRSARVRRAAARALGDIAG